MLIDILKLFCLSTFLIMLLVGNLGWFPQLYYYDEAIRTLLRLLLLAALGILSLEIFCESSWTKKAFRFILRHLKRSHQGRISKSPIFLPSLSRRYTVLVVVASFFICVLNLTSLVLDTAPSRLYDLGQIEWAERLNHWLRPKYAHSVSSEIKVFPDFRVVDSKKWAEKRLALTPIIEKVYGANSVQMRNWYIELASDSDSICRDFDLAISFREKALEISKSCHNAKFYVEDLSWVALYEGLSIDRNDATKHKASLERHLSEGLVLCKQDHSSSDWPYNLAINFYAAAQSAGNKAMESKFQELIPERLWHQKYDWQGLEVVRITNENRIQKTN